MKTKTRKSTAERQNEIVAAVLKIIGEKGVSALTTSTLVKEVGFSTGALFRHFDSWEDIYREVVHHSLTVLEKTFPDSSLPPVTRLFELANNRVHLFRANPGLNWLLRSEQAYLKVPEDSVDLLKTMVKRSKKYLLEAIEQGIEEGSIRKDLAAEPILFLVVGAIHASIGASGIHRVIGKKRGKKTEETLETLKYLITNPKTNIVKKRRS